MNDRLHLIPLDEGANHVTTVDKHVTVDRVRHLVATILELDVEQVDEQALLYEDLEVDSLHKTEIFAGVEREFHTRIDPEQWAAVRTIADVLALVHDQGVLTTDDPTEMADQHPDTEKDEGKWVVKLATLADLATPMAIRVAATLRIADHIAQGLRTAAELADAVHADPDALDRVLRLLTPVGVLKRDEQGRYALTELGGALRDDNPRGIRPWLDIDSALGRADLCYVQLLHTVRTGEAAFPAQFGRSFWEDLSGDTTHSASFDACMGSYIAPYTPAIVSAYDWGSLGHVVDVGGGNGSLLIALLAANPALRGTIIDLAGPADTARGELAAAGFGDRASVVTGSFFDRLPPGAGGYLLSSVIHNWDHKAACAILRRCAEAAGEDGSVFIIEAMGTSRQTRIKMDLMMLAYFGGRERGLTELTALATECGLRVVAVHPAGTRAIIELATA